jgi:hypothetical protein
LPQNINLRIEVQQRGIELKKLERELGRLQRVGGGGVRERELEERESEVRELRRRVGEGHAALREAETNDALLEWRT